VLAPVSGRIASVVHDRSDMPLGERDYEVPAGNTLSIQTSDGRYLLLAHLMQSTILVREGERVTAGQKIARCGNSGVASLPHLLLQARDRPGAWNGDAQGRTFPLRFIDALRIRDESVTLDPFVVRRNDIIEPLAVDEGE
jgi:murein DD-endopeptidase MepM/ murein hydrolase activator NlpD